MAFGLRRDRPGSSDLWSWLLLYAGVTVALYALVTLAGIATPIAPAAFAFALATAITGLALLAVIVDRLLFQREPDHLLTRQSPWVLVLVALTVAVAGGFVLAGVAQPGEAVLFALSFTLPVTMLLFAIVNLARHRTMEHGGE